MKLPFAASFFCKFLTLTLQLVPAVNPKLTNSESDFNTEITQFRKISSCTFIFWSSHSTSKVVHQVMEIAEKSVVTIILTKALVFLQIKSMPMKFQTVCSINYYFHLENIFHIAASFPLDWIHNHPGGIYNSYHIIYQADNELSIGYYTSLVQLPQQISTMFNQVFIINSNIDDLNARQDSLKIKLYTLNTWGNTFSEIPSWNKIFRDRPLDLEQHPLIWAFVPTQGIDQKALVKYLNNNKKPPQLFLDPTVTISVYLNATPAILTADDHGTLDPVTGEWSGVVREVLDGRAHLTQAVLQTMERHEALILTQPFDSDGLSFISAPPKAASGSVLFLLQSYDATVWIVQCILICLVALVLNLVKNEHYGKEGYSKLLQSFAFAIKPMIGQNEDFNTFAKVMRRPSSMIVFGSWLISTIVLGSVFKTNMISMLTYPHTEYPPRDFETLVLSNAKINFHGWDNNIGGFLFKTIRDMGNHIAMDLDKKIVGHFEDPNESKCLIPTQTREFVCVGFRNLIKFPAIRDLTRWNGEPLFLISQDSFIESNTVFGISKRLPCIRERFNRIVFLYVESGIYKYLTELLVRRVTGFGKLMARRRVQNMTALYPAEKEDNNGKESQWTEITNSLLVYGTGIGIAFCIWISELMFFYLTRQRVSTTNIEFILDPQSYNNYFNYLR